MKGYEVGETATWCSSRRSLSGSPRERQDAQGGAFIACNEVDTVYLDRPYYLAPSDPTSKAFVLLREAMREKKVAALARTVLFRRVRTLLIRPYGDGLIASTMNFDYEVRACRRLRRHSRSRIGDEMLDLAEHIIDTKKGAFDPAAYEDRYEAAVAELVRAKSEGGRSSRRRPRKEEKVVDLMEALRKSAGSRRRGKAGASRQEGDEETDRRRGGRLVADGRSVPAHDAATPSKRRNGFSRGRAVERAAIFHRFFG